MDHERQEAMGQKFVLKSKFSKILQIVLRHRVFHSIKAKSSQCYLNYKLCQHLNPYLFYE